eukprot:COSAG02_NODE_69_length_42323_cov_23.507850_29_plen_129_part_00
MKWASASLAEACDAVIYGEPATVSTTSNPRRADEHSKVPQRCKRYAAHTFVLTAFVVGANLNIWCIQVGGVSGGLVAMDSNGDVAYPFNSKGMYRGKMDSSTGLDTCLTLIWREDGDTHGELREQPIH